MFVWKQDTLLIVLNMINGALGRDFTCYNNERWGSVSSHNEYISNEASRTFLAYLHTRKSRFVHRSTSVTFPVGWS